MALGMEAISRQGSIVQAFSSSSLSLQKNPNQQTALSIIGDLGAVLLQYGAQIDPTSRNLMMTGSSFMMYGKANIQKPFEELLKGAIEKIEDIAEVLLDPDGSGTLKDPQLVANCVTWERSTAERFQRDAKRFEGKDIEVVPHEFAKSMIFWISTLPGGDSFFQRPSEDFYLLAQPQKFSEEMQEYQWYMNHCAFLLQMVNLQKGMEKSFSELERKLEENEQLRRANIQLREEGVQVIQDLRESLERLATNGRQRAAEFDSRLTIQEEKEQENEEMHRKICAGLMLKLVGIEGDLRKAKVHITQQQMQIINLCNELKEAHSRLSEIDTRPPLCNIL